MGIKPIFNKPVFPVRRLILRTSTHVEKIYHRSHHHDQVLVIFISNPTKTKKPQPTSNLSKHDCQYHGGRSNLADQAYSNKNTHYPAPGLDCRLPKSP